jgi:hypothetical protein
MIEIRFPTPKEEPEKVLELLDKFAEEEQLDKLPQDWHRFVYVEVPESKLDKLKKFLFKNQITEEKDIEEIESFNFPINPVEDVFLLVRFLKKNNIDFNLIPYIKLPKKDYEKFWKFLEEIDIWDEEE